MLFARVLGHLGVVLGLALEVFAGGQIVVPPSVSPTVNMICSSVASHLAATPSNTPAASSYCSSVLSISTRTVTSTTTVKSTLKIVVTSSATLVIAAPTNHLSTSTTVLSTETRTVTQIMSIPTSTTTQLITFNTPTSTTTVKLCVPTAKRQIGHDARAVSAELPESLFPTGCSCMSLTAPTATTVVLATDVIRETVTQVITSTKTTTPPVVTDTVTVTSKIDSDTTKSFTVNYVSTFTSTVTRPHGIATATSNLCVPSNSHKYDFWLNMPLTGPFAYIVGAVVNGSSRNELTWESSAGGNQAWLNLVQTSGLIQLTRAFGKGSYEDTVLYVKDPVGGGTAYFGPQSYIRQQGYYIVPCEIDPVPAAQNQFYPMSCYNALGDRFRTSVARNGNGTAALSVNVTSGYLEFDMNAWLYAFSQINA